MFPRQIEKMFQAIAEAQRVGADRQCGEPGQEVAHLRRADRLAAMGEREDGFSRADPLEGPWPPRRRGPK